MAAAMAVSVVWLPGNVRTVYAEEAEEEISAEPEIRNVNLNINGKIAGISDPTPAMTADAEWSNGTGSYINFGGYTNVTKYRVLDSDTTDFSLDGTHTILLDCNTVYDKRIFDNDAQNADNGQSKPNDWKYSDMYLYLNSKKGIAEPYTNYSHGYISACGKSYETDIIIESYNTSHSSWTSYCDDNYVELTGEKIFLLDSREATHGAYGYYEGSGASKSRAKSSRMSWGLRSAVSDSDGMAELATSSGDIAEETVTQKVFGLSAAFNIDKSSIFFVRADTACDHEHFLPTVAKNSANTWNLTLFDGNTVFDCERTDNGSVEYGDTIDIHVTSIGNFVDGQWSCPGKNGIGYDQISALIEDQNGTVVYYGGITDMEEPMSYSVWDELSIPVPEALEDGSYTLKIFAEDVNNSTMSKTHYASNTVDIPIEVYTKENTDISFAGYNPSADYSGNALADPTENQLSLTGASYEDVVFTWYQDSVAEDNKLDAAPDRAGTYYLVASILATPTAKASAVTSEAITIRQKSVTPYISGSISKTYDGTVSTENYDSSLGIGLNGVLSGDNVSADGYSFCYEDAEIGENKTVKATGIMLSGTDKDNYILSTSIATAAVGTIQKKETSSNSGNTDKAPTEGSQTDNSGGASVVPPANDGNSTQKPTESSPDNANDSAGSGTNDAKDSAGSGTDGVKDSLTELPGTNAHDTSENTGSSAHTDNVNNTDSLNKEDATEGTTNDTPSKVTVASVGTVLKDAKTNSKYVVTSKKSKTVQYSGTTKKNISSVSVPATVKISGVTYKVTSIAANAFKNNKKLQKVTIGSNVGKIGKNAFYGCKNLKSVTIRSTKLTSKALGKNVFKGISSKAVIKVPTKKWKSYKKLLASSGFKGKVQKVR
jgi:hypothetical protein